MPINNKRRASYKKNNKSYNRRTNNINLNKENLNNTIYKTDKYLTASHLAEYFNIKPYELNNIFKKLQWAEKSGKWWLATELGFNKGAKEQYNKSRNIKYIIWNSKVKDNYDLKNAVEQLKNDSIYKIYGNSGTMSKDEKKEKGDKYESYVADFFRNLDYYVWEHGKEKGVKDGGIDLFIKNGKHCFFVQCKDWETWKVDDKTVKATQTDVRNYMLSNPILTKLLNGNQKKILYVTSKDCLTSGAYRYIEENKHIIEHKVIPME